MYLVDVKYSTLTGMTGTQTFGEFKTLDEVVNFIKILKEYSKDINTFAIRCGIAV